MQQISYLIAGPCAAESEKQVKTTARLLMNELAASNFKLSYFRTGVWKPRSNPSEFKGVGKKALSWLRDIQQEYAWKVCVEVAKPEQIDLCEQYDIHAVWIGARTSVNPFLTEELAQAARGRNLTVMVKNPLAADLRLWIGAIERFQQAGIQQLVAIHRGIPHPDEKMLRNAPFWEMPIELKVQRPDVPLICDISHIAGNRNYLQTIAQQALDLSFDGLMIETHASPSQALCDAQQQLTPKELLRLLRSLICTSILEKQAKTLLFQQRSLIEHIDNQIGKLLAQRMQAVDKVAQIKKENHYSLIDTKQFQKVEKRYLNNSLPDISFQKFIHQYLELLHYYSILRQQNDDGQ
jgi:chorismate mutase